MSSTAIRPKLTVWELRQLYDGRWMIALDGKDGKILFDTRKNKEEFIQKYHDGEILGIWVDLKLTKHSGFASSDVEAVLMCYVSHNTWRADNE